MADDGSLSLLTGHTGFDSAIARFSDIHDAAEQETARAKIHEAIVAEVRRFETANGFVIPASVVLATASKP